MAKLRKHQSILTETIRSTIIHMSYKSFELPRLLIPLTLHVTVGDTRLVPCTEHYVTLGNLLDMNNSKYSCMEL